MLQAYKQVISDITAKRDALTMTLDALLACCPEGEAPEPKKAVRKAAPAERTPREPASEEKPVSAPRPEPTMTISAAVLQAVKESPRTSTEVADRVEELRPGTYRTSIWPDINTLVRAGKLHKDDALKLRVVQNGRIV